MDPKELYDRFRALESMAYNLRADMKAKGVKVKTRVKVGRSDLELSIKYPNTGWKAAQLPDGLPDIDLEAGGRISLTSSPPPGRPGRPALIATNQEKKRPLSGSENEEIAKKQKESCPDNDLSEIVSREEKSSDMNRQGDSKGVRSDIMNLDLGQFTSTEGVSPATPAKAKIIPDLSVLINSPVFHSKVGKN